MSVDRKTLRQKWGPDWSSEIAGDEAPDAPRAVILSLLDEIDRLQAEVYKRNGELRAAWDERDKLRADRPPE